MAQEEWTGGAQPEEAASQEGTEGLVENVKKNLPIIAVVVLVLGAVLFYLFVLPKPGTIVLNVVELDNEEKTISDAEVSVLDDSGNEVATATVSDGSAVIQGVPSGVVLSVSVSPSKGGYAKGSEKVNLGSGERKTVDVKIPRNYAVEFPESIPRQSLGAGCSKTVSLKVNNNGNSDVEVELVSDNDNLNNALSYEKKTIPAGGTDSISLKITAPEEGTELGGAIRVKYTKTSTSFDAKIGEAPEMRVDPSEIQINPGETMQVTINNYGKSDLTDISYKLGGDLSESDVEVIGFEQGVVVKPNRKTTFVVRGKTAGKVGKLKIISGCGEEEIPVSIKGAGS